MYVNMEKMPTFFSLIRIVAAYNYITYSTNEQELPNSPPPPGNNSMIHKFKSTLIKNPYVLYMNVVSSVNALKEKSPNCSSLMKDKILHCYVKYSKAYHISSYIDICFVFFSLVEMYFIIFHN